MTPLVLALLAKVTLIFSLGLIATATLRGFSPSLRHLILFAALAAGVALPVAMLLSPQWNVPVLPRSTASVFSLQSATSITAAGPSPSTSALDAKVIDATAAQSTSGARGILTRIPPLPLLW